MNFPEIGKLVPHAGPMVLLDRVISADGESLCAEIAIRPDTLFCDGKGVGAWIGVEYMAQAIAAHAGHAAYLRGEPVKVGFLLGSRRYECNRPAFSVGSVLRVHVQRTLQGENGLGAFECSIGDADDASGVPAATAIITVFQPEKISEFLQGISE